MIGIWYWCTDQTIVQRVLGARDENHARAGALFAGFIKILPLFIFVLPGTICYALVNQGTLNGSAMHGSADTYAFLIRELLPTGLKGLMAAALAGGRHVDRLRRTQFDRHARQLRLIETLATGRDRSRARLGRPLVFLCGDGAGDYLVAEPQSRWHLPGGQRNDHVPGAADDLRVPVRHFLATGLLDRRRQAHSWWARFVGLRYLHSISFSPAGGRRSSNGTNFDFLLQGVFLFLVCSTIMVSVSLRWPHQHTAESAALVWSSPWEPLESPGWPGLANYKFVSTLLILLLITIYYVLR